MVNILRSNTLVVCLLFAAATPAAGIDRQNPTAVKQTIEQIVEAQPPAADSTICYFSDSISHFDGFVPLSFNLATVFDSEKHRYKFTYRDGRIATCEAVDDSGVATKLYAVWHDDRGAPVLTTSYMADEPLWHMYAEYNEFGQVQTIYRFNKLFELQFFEVFSYEGQTTLVRRFQSDAKPTLTTLYDGDEVFLIQNGEKRKVNNGTRQQGIDCLVKFGLQPIYPDNR